MKILNEISRGSVKLFNLHLNNSIFPNPPYQSDARAKHRLTESIERNFLPIQLRFYSNTSGTIIIALNNKSLFGSKITFIYWAGGFGRKLFCALYRTIWKRIWYQTKGINELWVWSRFAITRTAKTWNEWEILFLWNLQNLFCSESNLDWLRSKIRS